MQWPPEQSIDGVQAVPVPHMHSPATQVFPFAHAGVHADGAHTPARQMFSPVHEWPHVPQLPKLVLVSAQIPSQQLCEPVHPAPVPQ